MIEDSDQVKETESEGVTKETESSEGMEKGMEETVIEQETEENLEE